MEPNDEQDERTRVQGIAFLAFFVWAATSLLVTALWPRFVFDDPSRLIWIPAIGWLVFLGGREILRKSS